MREIHAYQCADGSLFTDESKAKAHDDDLLGQEIDGLLKLYCLDITRNQEYKGCLSVMGKRKELLEASRAILSLLTHNEQGED